MLTKLVLWTHQHRRSHHRQSLTVPIHDFQILALWECGFTTVFLPMKAWYPHPSTCLCPLYRSVFFGIAVRMGPVQIKAWHFLYGCFSLCAFFKYSWEIKVIWKARAGNSLRGRSQLSETAALHCSSLLRPALLTYMYGHCWNTHQGWK